MLPKSVKPKKELGQHFLTDVRIAQRIVESLTNYGNYSNLVEVGPGTGALTTHLFKTKYKLLLAEIDERSIEYLKENFQSETFEIIGDFLQLNFVNFGTEQTGVIGNFPYNISSQILFKILENRQFVPEVVGMFQKEVARRIAQPPGDKEYGILSVLTQAYYKVSYLFTVNEGAFNPPPKVKSGVIRLERLPNEPNCDQKLLWHVVKTAFNQRRKMLSNSLRPIIQHFEFPILELANQRPEQLSVADFVALTVAITKQRTE